MVEDTQFYPSEEQLAAGSGDDCLWVGNTYGLGALRGWDGTKSLLLTDVKYQEQRVISEGPLRAVVEVMDNGSGSGSRMKACKCHYPLYDLCGPSGF